MQAEVIHALGNPGGNGIDQGLQAAPIGALVYYSQLVHLKSINGHYRCHVDITSGSARHQEEQWWKPAGLAERLTPSATTSRQAFAPDDQIEAAQYQRVGMLGLEFY